MDLGQSNKPHPTTTAFLSTSYKIISKRASSSDILCFSVFGEGWAGSRGCICKQGGQERFGQMCLRSTDADNVARRKQEVEGVLSKQSLWVDVMRNLHK